MVTHVERGQLSRTARQRREQHDRREHEVAHDHPATDAARDDRRRGNRSRCSCARGRGLRRSRSRTRASSAAASTAPACPQRRKQQRYAGGDLQRNHRDGAGRDAAARAADDSCRARRGSAASRPACARRLRRTAARCRALTIQETIGSRAGTAGSVRHERRGRESDFADRTQQLPGLRLVDVHLSGRR